MRTAIEDIRPVAMMNRFASVSSVRTAIEDIMWDLANPAKPSVSSVRITIENTIHEVKIFHIIAEKYRNRKRRFTPM